MRLNFLKITTRKYTFNNRDFTSVEKYMRGNIHTVAILKF